MAVLKRLALAAAIAIGAAGARAEAPAGFHDLSVANLQGAETSMVAYAGHAVLLVNTASFCGFTYQYEALQTLWEAYRDRGLVVIGAPSDDFGGQEYDDESDVAEFCAVNFAIDFPMTEILAVKGPDRHPLYAWAATVLGDAGEPRWNFHKILIGPDGRAIDGFPSVVEPDDPSLIAAIETVLPR